MLQSSKRPLILLAEDSEDDAFFFRWTLQKCGFDCELVHAVNGVEAVKILQSGENAEGARASTRPDLVFLDLKMPAMTGFEVLEWIQQHPMNPPLDVAVLSGSEHASDVDRAKRLGASSFYVKPLSVKNLQDRFETWRTRHTPATAAAPEPTLGDGASSGPNA
jgi:CheY-like chemotaxis protein